ncbi:hypothetical protein DFS34DRAFT_669178 [Phlyctochytrium arcticum]|nr:hypothetical protein DFS34DRAFT_598458 [Phlyctochytrium arcticum]KAI9088040.1 hypothetical protein DFS34DRAFT_598450 [Phlyctochytrium arcticum]KAI9104142.1 hypothetical protein DFS34DRAFT_669178 [Phlyctochytrium arcticum]
MRMPVLEQQEAVLQAKVMQLESSWNHALNLPNLDRVEESALPAISIPTNNTFSILDDVTPTITSITPPNLTETVEHIVSAILESTHDEIPSSSESDFVSSDESDQLTTDDSDEFLEPDVVVPLSIEAVLGNARKQLAASARVMQELAVVPDDSPYESPAELPPPVRRRSASSPDHHHLKSSLARAGSRPRKTVRFNQSHFQHVCVIKRGIKAIDIPTCPRFIQSVQDINDAADEEREAFEALTPASIPPFPMTNCPDWTRRCGTGRDDFGQRPRRQLGKSEISRNQIYDEQLGLVRENPDEQDLCFAVLEDAFTTPVVPIIMYRSPTSESTRTTQSFTEAIDSRLPPPSLTESIFSDTDFTNSNLYSLVVQV